MLDTDPKYKSSESSSLPSWFRQRLPEISKIKTMKNMVQSHGLSTVCEHAQCPNMGQCWGKGVATFMILGNTCTRACRFCAVQTGGAMHVDPSEPMNVAKMVKQLGLKYVVVTSVTRDDLVDEGVAQFVKTIRAIREQDSNIKIELLIPDFSGRLELIREILEAKPDVLGHNIEMVERLFPEMRFRTDYQRSLTVLRQIKQSSSKMLVKSGFMVGLGETDEEVFRLMKDLVETGCDMLTIGQYLAPSKDKRHVPVDRFVSPETFDHYKERALALGFRHVFSAPLVRSSYIAEEGYRECCNDIENMLGA